MRRSLNVAALQKDHVLFELECIRFLCAVAPLGRTTLSRVALRREADSARQTQAR
jgi:hypothetical protein